MVVDRYWVLVVLLAIVTISVVVLYLVDFDVIQTKQTVAATASGDWDLKGGVLRNVREVQYTTLGVGERGVLNMQQRSIEGASSLLNALGENLVTQQSLGDTATPVFDTVKFTQGSPGFLAGFNSSRLLQPVALADMIKSAADQSISVIAQSDGSVTLSLGADGGFSVPNATPNRLVYVDSHQTLATVANLSAWLVGTTNQTAVTPDSDGRARVSLTQDLAVTSTPVFASARLTDVSAMRLVMSDVSQMLNEARLADFLSSANTGLFSLSDNGSGGLALSAEGHLLALNQNLSTTSSPQFLRATLTNGVCLKETGGGSSVVTLKAPADVALDYSLALPPSDGVPGQVLSTNGNGELQWITGGIGGGEINTAANLGSGKGLYSTKVGVQLRFKSLLATSSKLTITDAGTTVNLDVNEGALGATSVLSLQVRGLATSSLLATNAAHSLTTWTLGSHLIQNAGTLDVANLTTEDVAENGVNQYFTSARARGAVSGTGGVIYNTGDGVFSLEPHVIFESCTLTDGVYSVTLAAPLLENNYTLTLPTTDGSSGEMLVTDGNGALSWVTAGTLLTHSNVTGSVGVGLYYEPTLNDIRFKSILGASSKLTVADGGEDVLFDVDESQFGTVVGTSYAVGSSVLTAQEFGHLVGLDQPLTMWSSPTFNSITGTLQTGAQTNITSVGTLTAFNTSAQAPRLSHASFQAAGVVHTDTVGRLSTSLLTNADVHTSAAIDDTKLATIATAGKVSNSATSATSANTMSAIVTRDASGNFTAGTLTISELTIGTHTLAASEFAWLEGVNQALATTSNVMFGVITGTLQTAAQTNVTSVGTLTAFNTSAATPTFSAFTTAGVIHNNGVGQLSTALLVNDDVAPSAAIVDTKLATLATAGKVSNSATTATHANTLSTIVARDASGNFTAGTVTVTALTIGGHTLNTSQFVFLAGINQALSLTSNVTFNSIKGTLQTAAQTNVTSVGTLTAFNTSAATPTFSAFTTAGVIHNNASGELSTTLLVNADVHAAAAIDDTKLATIATAGKVSNSATSATSANTMSAIVTRDPLGNFTAGTLTISALTIGTHTLTTSEFAFLDGVNQALAMTANVTFNQINGTLQTAAQTNVTSVGTLTAFNTSAETPTFSHNAFTTAGVIHNNNVGQLSTALLVNDDVHASAAIADTKLATLATMGKVSNSATTATDANTASAIVARDALGNFTAGTLTVTALTIGDKSLSSSEFAFLDGLNQALGTASSPVFANVTVSGDLIVTGTTTTLSAVNLEITDAFIKIAKDNTTMAVDMGFYGQYRTNPADAETTTYSGFYRDGATNQWYLFDDINTEPVNGFSPVPADVTKWGLLGVYELTATNVTGTLQTAAQTNVTSVGTLTAFNTSAATPTFSAFTTAGVIHNNGVGQLSTALLVNDDVAPSAAIVDTKLATLATAGKVSNSATTATHANTLSTIVARDASGNFTAGTVTVTALTIGGNTLNTSQFAFLEGVDQALATTSNVSFAQITGTLQTAAQTNVTSVGTLTAFNTSAETPTFTTFTTAGVIHNNGVGQLSTSLLFNADVHPSADIADTKLATLATAGKVSNSATTATHANTLSTIVARDASGNFTAGTVTVTALTIGGNTLNTSQFAFLEGVDQALATTSNVTFGVITGTLQTAAQTNVTSVGTLTAFNTSAATPTFSAFTTAGVIHNNASGELSTTLLVNADVHAAAAIDDTKLATIATAGKVSNSATTATDANTASAIVARNASGDFAAGAITAKTSLRLEDPGVGQNTVTLQAPSTWTSGAYTLTLPVNIGTPSQVLQTDGAGVLSWATVSSGSGSTPTFESVTLNLLTYAYAVTYDGSNRPSTMTYTVPAVGTMVKTFTYSSGLLSTIALSGNTPVGLATSTKNFSYTGSRVTGVAYS